MMGDTRKEYPVVEINLDASGVGYIKIDGEKVNYATAITIEANVRKITKVHMTIVPERVIFTGPAIVTTEEEDSE